jgi:hypothetical protein
MVRPNCYDLPRSPATEARAAVELRVRKFVVEGAGNRANKLMMEIL